MSLDLDGKEAEARIAKALHYPDCWDTMAYPTLAIAVWELAGIHRHGCPTCKKECGQFDWNANTNNSKKENKEVKNEEINK